MELADETLLQASRWTSKRTWCSAHKRATLLYETHANCICLHWMLLSAQHRGLHRGQGSCQVLSFEQPQKNDYTSKEISSQARLRTWRRENKKRRRTFGVRGGGGDLRTIQWNTVHQMCLQVSTAHWLPSLPWQHTTLPRMQQLPAIQVPALLIPSSHRLGGVCWHRHLHLA